LPGLAGIAGRWPRIHTIAARLRLVLPLFGNLSQAEADEVGLRVLLLQGGAQALIGNVQSRN
jgi:hypothetical protein